MGTPARALGDGLVIHEDCDHLLFVGFSGSGKSTVVRNLGCMFRRRTVDLDRVVERRLHGTLPGVWIEYGEQAFRAEEHKALLGLKQEKSLLVACGGGTVATRENREPLALTTVMS